MTYAEFQRQLGKAGLTIRDFADLIKMHRTSVTNYKRDGEVPAHLAIIATLMGEMAEHKIDFREALSRIDVLSKKPRGAGQGKFGGNKRLDLNLPERE